MSFFALHATTNNFFIKDTFTKNGLTLKYTGVLKMKHTSQSDYASDLKMEFYLASFYVEEINYEGEKYEEHQLFGHTFPEELFSNLKIKGLLSYEENNVEFNAQVSSLKATQVKLSTEQFSKLKEGKFNINQSLKNGAKFKIKLLKTIEIDFPVEKDFISKLITDISTNTTAKTKAQKKAEYVRLLIEGNLLLSKNNYNESFKSFSIAKKYTEETAFINSKIEIVESYIAKNNTSKYRWAHRQSKSNLLERKVEPVKKDRFVSSKGDFKRSDEKNKLVNPDNGKQKVTQQNTSSDSASTITNSYKKNTITTTKVDAFNALSDSVSKLKEAKNKVQLSNNKSLSYGQLLKKGNDLLSSKNFLESKVYFEAAQAKAPNKRNVNKILASVNSLISSAQVKQDKVVNTDNLSELSSSVVNENTEISGTGISNEEEEETGFKTNDSAIETFGRSSQAGFIKFKRDKQAVFDRNDNVLIPFGKYEIIRYRSGFANVRLKDTISLKKIVCTGKNGEYSWSARIYQNPWVETVVDENGEYVDDFDKKVEIYVVDNVSLLPYEQVPQSIKDAYKDPNQFTGTNFISAFNLWEKENSKRPDIIARRKEIEAFKQASKKEAYSGADRCKQKVSVALEEVLLYYKNLGYEIKIRH